tara:strand:+ start:72 stop:248 length:177 start_codon:yes stop_codon:yes gene_type:complete
LDKSSEEWRRICEAKYVLQLPFPQRKPYLQLIEKKRNLKARKILEADIFNEFNRKTKS